MAVQINKASFEKLLQDDVFIDYLNKFLSLPIFGQRIIYRKKQDQFLFEPDLPEMAKYGRNIEIIDWIWQKRLPFFFRSHIYAEYKLARALIEYDLVEDGGVEEHVARGLEYLQFHCFSKMSRFSKFCKFLSETGEGLKLVAFFIAAQHLFVAYYEGDPDFAVYMGEVRDRFFDETSCWCLPNKVLTVTSEQSNSIAFCMCVSQRVLSRMCLYWLPRYLLHLRMKDFKNDPDFADLKFNDEMQKLSDTFLHSKIFKTTSKTSQTNIMKGFESKIEIYASDTDCARPTRRRLGADSAENIRDPFCTIDEECPSDASIRISSRFEVKPKSRWGKTSTSSADISRSVARDRATVNERRNTIRREARRTDASGISIPGVDIKVERKKSVKPSLLHLASAMSLMRGPIHSVVSEQKDLKTEEKRNGISSTLSRRTQAAGVKSTTIVSKSGRSIMTSKSSVTSIASRALGVSKAINQFKLNRQNSDKETKEKKTKDDKDTVKKFIKELHAPYKETNTDRKRVKNSNRDSGPIGPMKESKNVFKLSKAVKSKAGEESFQEETEEEETEVNETNKRLKGIESTKKKAAEKKSALTLKPADSKPPTPEEGAGRKSEREESSASLAAVVTARSLIGKWKKKVETKSIERNSTLGTNGEEPDNRSSVPKAGLKMVFAMSDRKKSDDRSIKVITRRDNRLTEEIIEETESQDNTDEIIPENYLRKRRNALGKVKPIKTLRKRPHSEIPSTAAVQPKNGANAKSGNANINTQNTGFQEPVTAEGKRKAEFIKKALMAGNMNMEKLEVERTQTGDSIMSSIYSMNDDYVFRHEMRHLKAAFRSDDFAAGPFMAYLTDEQNDEASMFALCFWQEVERFREEFSGMQQSDLVLAMDAIMTKYILNDRGFTLVPGMREYGIQMVEVDILNTLTFPWQLRLVQRYSMEHLNEKWKDYIQSDTNELYEQLGVSIPDKHFEDMDNSISKIFEEEVPPVPLPGIDDNDQPKEQPKESITSNKWTDAASKTRKTTMLDVIETAKRKSTLHQQISLQSESNLGKAEDGSHLNLSPVNASKRPTRRTQTFMNPNMIRLTLGHDRHSEVLNNPYKNLLRNAMARRSKRAYALAEQTCRLTARQPQSSTFLENESDDEGFVKPVGKPTYLRKPKIDPKTLVTLAKKEYPSSTPSTRKTAVIRNVEKTKTPSWMKDTIRKNGVVLKRPMVRPKHLIDCLRDPVHFEFFRRFAKAFHFERSVRFWKAIEIMKHVDDSRLRLLKIKSIVSQFFAKGATTGVGIDGPVLREIMRVPPEKVTVSMLISAQACVMKALEDMWAERYLTTFPEAKKSTAVNHRVDRTEIMGGMNTGSGQMTNIWRVFYAFIKRSAKFIKCMKNMEIRNQFELYLESVGRDPTVYHEEGWMEIAAQSIDSYLNGDLMYHQKKQQGRFIIAEFLLNDFRFWCEVECYRCQAEAIHQNGHTGRYSAKDEENLHDKAQLICDQYLNSMILPRCRINIQPEISATIIENVKLGMFDLSLFHDCTINIFPLLLFYWKKFCFRRHKYLPRNEVIKFKHKQAKERRERCLQLKKKKKPVKITCGDGPLIDYCTNKRYTHSWMDIVKTLEDQGTMSFTISTGVKLSLPVQQKLPKPQADRQDSNTDTSNNRGRR